MAIQYICNNLQRKTKIRENIAGLNGIDYLEVYDSQDEADPGRQKKLFIHFVLPDFDNNIENLIEDNIRIEGGSRVKDIKAVNVNFDLTAPDTLEVDVNRYGDFPYIPYTSLKVVVILHRQTGLIRFFQLLSFLSRLPVPVTLIANKRQNAHRRPCQNQR